MTTLSVRDILFQNTEPINKRIMRCISNLDAMLTEQDKDEAVRLGNQIIKDTSLIISYCINNMMKINKTNPYLSAITNNNEEDDVLFGNLLVLMDRKISFNRVQAPMAVSMKETELTLEINPMYLFSGVMDDIKDKYSDEEIQNSLESDNTPASMHYVLQIMSILCHECMHVIYEHLDVYSNLFKKGKHYATLMNYATDCTINQYLEFLPSKTVTLDYIKELTNNPNLKEKDGSWNYYNELLKAMPEPEAMPQELKQMLEKTDDDSENSLSDNGSGLSQQDTEQALQDLHDKLSGMSPDELEEFKEGLKQRIDSHDNWGVSNQNNQDIAPELISDLVKSVFESAYDNYVEERTISGKNRGNISGNIQEKINIIKEKTKMDWKQILKKKIGTLAIPYKLSKNRVNRRQPFRPELRGKVYDRRVKVTFAIDTSGSMTNSTLKYVLQELFTLLDAYDFELTVIECDARIQRVYKAKSNKDINPNLLGRGGTLFQPIFDYAYEHNYKNREDLIIFATDGGGESTIDYKKFTNVMWLLVDGKHLSVNNPKGQVLYLNDDKKYKEWIKNENQD